MFLSTQRKFFPFLCLCIAFFQACSQAPANENKAVSLTETDKSEFPFSTKEPEVYQGDFVVSFGKIEQRYSFARKGEKRRIDFFHEGEQTLTHIVSDKTYILDHGKKAFSVASGPEGNLVDVSAPYSYFRNIEYRKFDLTSHSGDITIYGSHEEDGSGKTILVTFDSSVGMIVKEKFLSRNGSSGPETIGTFEIQNLKTDVDDSLFSIPASYKQLSFEELWPRKYPETKTR